MNCLAVACKATGSEGDRQPERKRAAIQFSGLRVFFDRLLDDIALTAGTGKINFPAVLHVVRQTAQRLEHAIAPRNDDPDITSQSRALLGWFRYFADEIALKTYVDATMRWQDAVKDRKTASRQWREPLIVHFRPTKHLYHWRRFPGGTRITLPTPMICFDDGLMRQLAQYMLRRRPNAAITDAMLVPPYRSIADRLNELGGAVEETQGIFYDLADSFARVNREYFSNQSQRPMLTWSQRLTRRKFGHYDLVRDTVMISRTLDHPDVPVFVLDHVMHHELLHKKHGFNSDGRRRCFHTPAFRAEERTFARFVDADRFLNQIAKARSC